MKNKHILVIIAIFATLIMAGCTTGDRGEGAAGGGIGGNGLSIKWTPNVPPNRIYEDQPFEIAVEVENLGANEIGSSTDRIYFSGFSRERISGDFYNGIQIPKLDAQTRYNSGGKDLVSITGTIADLETQNEYQIPLTATACYEYSTEAGGTICIDPDPFTTSTRKKSCTPGSVTLGAQGAPVKITGVQTEPARGKTRLTITVSNTGGGDVYRRESLAYCNPYNTQRASYNSLNVVQVEDVSIGGTTIQCTGLGNDKTLRLIGGRGQMRCTYETTQTTEFTDQFKIKVRYGYRTSIQKNVVILPTD